MLSPAPHSHQALTVDAFTAQAPVKTLNPLTPIKRLEIWQLIVELLPDIDPDIEFLCPNDLAPLLGDVAADTVCGHCRDVFKEWEGHFRLSIEQATKVIKRYCLVGRRKHSRATLEELVREKRTIMGQPTGDEPTEGNSQAH